MTENDIAVRQNQPDMIRYLAAQRQLYSEEKQWKMTWYAVVTAIALMATGFLPATDKFLPQLTAIMAAVAIVELVVLPFIGKKRIIAAGIQELFDCELLHLEWNEMLVERPDPHQVDGAVDRFNRQPNQGEAYDKLKDWYSGFTAEIPFTQARLICQKINLWWDEEVRSEWQKFLYVGSGIVIIISFLLGLFRQWPVTTYFTGPFLLLVPVILMAFKTAWSQNSVRKHLDDLNRKCDYLLRDAKHIDADEALILQQSRQLQDEIYRHRSTDTTVPDLIYERVRKRKEQHLT